MVLLLSSRRKLGSPTKKLAKQSSRYAVDTLYVLRPNITAYVILNDLSAPEPLAFTVCGRHMFSLGADSPPSARLAALGCVINCNQAFEERFFHSDHAVTLSMAQVVYLHFATCSEYRHVGHGDVLSIKQIENEPSALYVSCYLFFFSRGSVLVDRDKRWTWVVQAILGAKAEPAIVQSLLEWKKQRSFGN